ncbi:hypothetical protein MTO96_003034 [Rhipicephalus appendiculatus]
MGLSVATRILLLVSLLVARSATSGNAAVDEASATEPYAAKQLDAPAEYAVTAGLQSLDDDAGSPPPTDDAHPLTAVKESPQDEELAEGQNEGLQDTAQGDMAVAEERSDRSYAAVHQNMWHSVAA